MSDDTVRELQETLDEIKDLWQQGETLELPGPIERARALAQDLEPTEPDRSVKAGCQGYTRIDDPIDYETILDRVREDATEQYSPLPGGVEVSPDEWEVTHCVIEDCVAHYRVDHPDCPVKSEVTEFAV